MSVISWVPTTKLFRNSLCSRTTSQGSREQYRRSSPRHRECTRRLIREFDRIARRIRCESHLPTTRPLYHSRNRRTEKRADGTYQCCRMYGEDELRVLTTHRYRGDSTSRLAGDVGELSNATSIDVGETIPLAILRRLRVSTQNVTRCWSCSWSCSRSPIVGIYLNARYTSVETVVLLALWVCR